LTVKLIYAETVWYTILTAVIKMQKNQYIIYAWCLYEWKG